MLYHQSHDDTIVAISTPPGIGAIGVVRMSGPEAIAIAERLFIGKNLKEKPSHTVHFGRFRDLQKKVIDEVVLTLFRGPHSYTGEDVIEISGHGSPLIMSQILEACLSAGARLAQPGEYTMRAFFHGRMDLAQAEAVGDLIAANSEAARRTALNQLRGGYSNELNKLREELIKFSALIELELDFAEEDVTFADRNEFRNLLQTIRNKTNHLILSFRLGNVIKNGVAVAIIGRPNAGKSTLLNALLNEDRAIVSDIAGTTRDTIEESLNIDGVLFRLIDTAGIRTHTTDTIEALGIERSRANAEKADIIVYVQDLMDREEPVEWLAPYIGKVIEVGTKYDLYQTSGTQHVAPSLLQSGRILFSPVLAESSIAQLKTTLYNKAIGTTLNTEDSIVTNARHHEALRKVDEALDDISDGLDSGLSGDLLALDIRSCLYYLGTITGKVDVDRDVLGKIFSSFCIGK